MLIKCIRNAGEAWQIEEAGGEREKELKKREETEEKKRNEEEAKKGTPTTLTYEMQLFLIFLIIQSC